MMDLGFVFRQITDSTLGGGGGVPNKVTHTHI